MTERYQPPSLIMPARGRPKGRIAGDGGRASGPLLNARHERFALALFQGMPLTKAYVHAGYTGGQNASQSAIRLKMLPHVQRRLMEFQERAAHQAIITAPEVLKGLKEIAQKRASTKKPLWADKLRAYEALARALGMFKIEDTKEVEVKIVVDQSEAAY